MKRIACIIPCRKGSKRIPGKNLRPLAGKPLLSHILESALASRSFIQKSGRHAGTEESASTAVSTHWEGCGIHVVSDDPKALELAQSTSGVSAIELPSHMAGSSSPILPVLLQAAELIDEREEHNLDAICYLRATSPFVHPTSINRAVAELLASVGKSARSLDSVVGVKQVTGAHPSRFKQIDQTTGLLQDSFPDFKEGPVPQRSETLTAFQRNSAITTCWGETLRAGSLWGLRAQALLMGDVESLDINTPLEFEFAEFLSSRLN